MTPRKREPLTRFRDEGPGGADADVAALFRAVPAPLPLEASELGAVRRRLTSAPRESLRVRARQALMVGVALLSGAGVAFGGWGIVHWAERSSAPPTLPRVAAPPAASPRSTLRRAAPRSAPLPPPSAAEAEPGPEPVAATSAPAKARAPASAFVHGEPPAARTTASPPPDGTLSRESQALTVALVALRRQRDPRAALAALDAYDAEFPNGTLRREALVARLDAWSALGDCARVLGAVDALVDGAAPPAVRERALYARASCRLRRGDRVTAEADLRRYLAAYPGGRYAAEVEKLLGAGTFP